MQASALIARVSLNINRMPEQGPSVSDVPFHIGAGIEKISQPRQVFHLNRLMSGRPGHGRNPPGRAKSLKLPYLRGAKWLAR
jgi:hypothetical protein